LSGLILVMGYDQPGGRRRATIACVIISALTLNATGSITSIVSLVTALSTILIIRYMSTVSKMYRRAVMPWLVMAGGATVGLLMLLLPRFDVFSFVGRNETLTGRTELWDVGLDVVSERSALGVGYQAFWVEGNADAERLWAAFDIEHKAGFHFHNFYVQLLVDLGMVGFVVFGVMIACLLIRIGLPLLADRIPRRSLVYVPVTVLFLVRSASEVDFFGPFSIGTILVFLVAFQSMRKVRDGGPRSGAVRGASPRDVPGWAPPRIGARRTAGKGNSLKFRWWRGHRGARSRT
jgi:exopolysaccharide production protein ExoQ